MASHSTNMHRDRRTRNGLPMVTMVLGVPTECLWRWDMRDLAGVTSNATTPTPSAGSDASEASNMTAVMASQRPIQPRPSPIMWKQIVLCLTLWAAVTHCFTVKPSYPRPRIQTSVDPHYSMTTIRLPFQQAKRHRPLRIQLPLSSSAEDDASSVSLPSESFSSKLDSLLSTLTSAFPLFVLGSAMLAIARPQTLLWVNRGNTISIMLASVMCGTGLTLTPKDFEAVYRTNAVSVPLGVACQFGIMPLAAAWVGRAMFLNHAGMATTGSAIAAGKALFLGLCLVGCSPGGTASNLVSLIAKADVALSVILTACSTLLAVIATPALVKLLVGSNISVSGMALVQATAKVVLAPVLLGMVLNQRAPKLSRMLARWTPFLSVVLVSLICGGVVAETVPLLSTLTGGVGQTRQVALAVAFVHCLGFAAGYMLPKFAFKRSERTSRTISIEVGMQNSALAVVLARSLGAPPLASLPGALSATAHSCLGSMLAAYWRLKGVSDSEKEDNTDSAI